MLNIFEDWKQTFLSGLFVVDKFDNPAIVVLNQAGVQSPVEKIRKEVDRMVTDIQFHNTAVIYEIPRMFVTFLKGVIIHPTKNKQKCYSMLQRVPDIVLVQDIFPL